MNRILRSVFRSKKNKPRRKPRKRSEIFPENSITKQSLINYDPIMEVSSRFDNEDAMLVFFIFFFYKYYFLFLNQRLVEVMTYP